ncbi:putative DNA-binding protein [Oscillibacter valericigenes Sjm18-20]|nr:putative DNA-binding protein [Oscillibacter valericigenes Sjm18-20]
MELTIVHYRYLLTIYQLSREMLDVGATELAQRLSVTKPSVTSMLGILMDRGLLVRERYGKIYLTGDGVLLARKFEKRVETVKSRIPSMGFGLTVEETDAVAYGLVALLPERCLET